jgi:hypothetical protein
LIRLEDPRASNVLVNLEKTPGRHDMTTIVGELYSIADYLTRQGGSDGSLHDKPMCPPMHSGKKPVAFNFPISAGFCVHPDSSHFATEIVGSDESTTFPIGLKLDIQTLIKELKDQC